MDWQEDRCCGQEPVWRCLNAAHSILIWCQGTLRCRDGVQISSDPLHLSGFHYLFPGLGLDQWLDYHKHVTYNQPVLSVGATMKLVLSKIQTTYI